MTTESRCCEEFARAAGLSRRGFLRGRPSPAARPPSPPSHGTAFTSTAYAAAPADRVLVVLSMRGRLRRAEPGRAARRPGYYAARPTIAVPPTRLLAKDGFFGLHPALAPLLPWWTRRHDGRRARRRAARTEPLALLRDGGARGRRPRLLGPHRAGSTG